MTKYITVTDSKGEKQYTDQNLPLRVGGPDSCEITIPNYSGIAGHIGDADGHLFFQPVESVVAPFHNNREIDSSVWLKSGDSLQISSTNLQLTVTGDYYTFILSPRADSNINLVPPPPETTVSSQVGMTSESLPVEPLTPVNKRAGRLLLVFSCALLSILLLCSMFILFARPVQLEFNPIPDSMTLRGFPPPLPYGGKYLSLPGSYTASASKKGYHPFRETIEVASNRENTFSFNLKKLPGILKLSIIPDEEVSIFVDDQQVGVTPLESIEVESGSRLLRLEKSRYLPFTEEIEIGGMGQIQIIEAELQPAWSYLTLESDPNGAQVSMDGQEHGATPLKLELLQGSHTIVLTKQDYLNEEIEIESIAGQDSTAVVQLTPSPADIQVTSNPAGASVMVNDKYAGSTPVQLKLSPTVTQHFTVKAAGYSDSRQTHSFTAGEKRTLDFNLKPEYGTVFFQVNPPVATLYIDGKKQANANGRKQLPTKPHKIEVRHPSYASHTATIHPKKAFSQQVTVNLQPQGTIQAAQSANTSKPVGPPGKKMILISPEKFTMGAPRREPGRRANEQVREVLLDKDFYASANLVTNKEFRKFRPAHSSGAAGKYTLDGDDQPVVNVTWEDGARYLNWLSEKEGLTPFYRIGEDNIVPVTPYNNGYRFITEAEWAYIARKANRNTSDRFPWPGDYPPRQPYGNFSDVSAGNITSFSIPGYNDNYPVSSPVGYFPANAAGFYDLGGNVAEWCHDFYAAYNSANLPNPLGPQSGNLHVIRGSSWRDSSIAELRFSYRRYHNKPRDFVGFRIARYAE